MSEITRVLKPGGIVLISAEDIYTNARFFKVIMMNVIASIIRIIGVDNLLKRYLGKVITRPQKIISFNFNTQTGYHQYIFSDYPAFLKSMDLNLKYRN